MQYILHKGIFDMVLIHSVVFSWVCISTTCLGCYGLATMFSLSESAPWLGALHHGTGLTENQRLEYVVCQYGH